jgi:hypothetical protein
MVEDRSGNVGARFIVLDVFPTHGPGAMILGWNGYRIDLDADGPMAQAFTLRDWRDRWKVIHDS